MKSVATPPLVPVFKPKELRFEDVDWLAAFQSEDFQFIGLCKDPDRKGCYGKPVIVDPVAAPLQGLPYVMELRTQPERELNDVLWQIHVLSQREHSFTARLTYQWAVKDTERPRTGITPEAHFEETVRRGFEAGVYPKWSLHAITAGCPVYYQPGGGPRNEFGDELPDELTRFHHLDFVSKVIYGLEQHARWIRQIIYFEKAVAADLAQQRIEFERRLAGWDKVDAQREQARLIRIKQKRANPEMTFTVEAPQLDMFSL